MFRHEDTSASDSFTGGSYETGSSSMSGSGSTSGSMKDQAMDAASQAQQKVAGLKDQATQQAASKLDDRKGQAAEGITSFAGALRQAGDQLRQSDQNNVAQYTDQAAERIEQFASYLQGQDLGQMVDEVERFARRQPMIFMGGAFLLGILGARFLKASRPAGSGMYSGYQSGTQGYAGYSGYSGYSSGYTGSGGSYATTHGRTSGYGTGLGDRSTTAGSAWNTGTTGRGVAQETSGFSGSTSGSQYPEMDTGHETQGYKASPGAASRGTAGITDTSVTGATGRGTGRVSRRSMGVDDVSETTDSGTAQSWRDSNATE
jgi:hypothetical protein